MEEYDQIILTKNFLLREFYVSTSHPDIAKKSVKFHEDIFALKLLTIEILQKIRDQFGPLKILSGFRSEELNHAINGSKRSDHLFGSAADFVPISFDISQVYSWIALDSKLPYRQVILYPEEGFIHISNNLPTMEVRHEALVKDGDKYVNYQEFIDNIEKNKGEIS